MENATKALIIAAAVLITIVLVALGVRLLNSTSDIKQSATQTGEAITDKTGDVVSSILNDLADIYSMDEAAFYQYIKSKYSGERTGKEVLDLCNLIKKKYGSLHKSHDVAHITCGDEEINRSNIENKIKKENKYDVKFYTSYSISVTEK